jgi:hypothetical protein
MGLLGLLVVLFFATTLGYAAYQGDYYFFTNEGLSAVLISLGMLLLGFYSLSGLKQAFKIFREMKSK